jgi:5'-nucleotidase
MNIISPRRTASLVAAAVGIVLASAVAVQPAHAAAASSASTVSALAAAGPDTTAPKVYVTKPKNPTKVSSWKTIKGTVSDSGHNAKYVYLNLIELRGRTLYYYNPSKSKWVKFRTAGAIGRKADILVKVKGNSTWSVKVKGLQKGRLLITFAAIDAAGNTSAVKQRSQKLTR